MNPWSEILKKNKNKGFLYHDRLINSLWNTHLSDLSETKKKAADMNNIKKKQKSMFWLPNAGDGRNLDCTVNSSQKEEKNKKQNIEEWISNSDVTKIQIQNKYNANSSPIKVFKKDTDQTMFWGS